MSETWYKKCMPRIKDVEKRLPEITNTIKKINGIKHVYVWGSYRNNYEDTEFRIKDLDIIAKTSFNSEDLISISDKIINAGLDNETLIEQGYDPDVVQFSKEFIKIKDFNIDHWAITDDNKLLHWGAIVTDKEEADDINKEAEKYAQKETGINRQKINKSSLQKRNSWYNSYHNYISNFFSDMPSGWYCSTETNIRDILKNSMKID